MFSVIIYFVLGVSLVKGEEVKYEDEDEQYTYTEAPYYSYVPGTQMISFSGVIYSMQFTR